MTGNGFSYVKNRSLRELLAAHQIRHLTTEPYRPRTNGKVERFHQTMTREWAKGVHYRSHRHRKRRAATLARALQQAQTSKRDRRPTADQPRSQRLWIGHLAEDLELPREPGHEQLVDGRVVVGEHDTVAVRDKVSDLERRLDGKELDF